MDGFDCLGATDTSDDFSSFLKKEGINLMSKTADQLSKDGTKKPAADDKKKPASKGTSSIIYPIAGFVGGAAAGSILWKAHRVWGGILGSGVGGALGRIAGMFF